MDITGTTEPRSDQQNFDDYIGGPRTVTVADVKKGSAEQPVEVHLVEYPGRPYKPGKSMRRVLIACWGPEAEKYKGRRMTLFGDPTVRFAGQEVGGIRIAALSNLAEPKKLSLTVTRGKRAPFIVQPLRTEKEHGEALQKAKTLDELRIAWQVVTSAGLSKEAALIEAKDARKVELAKVPVEDDPTLTAEYEDEMAAKS